MAHTEQTYFWEQNYKDIKTGKKPWKPARKWLPSYCSILQLPSGSWGSNSQSTAWNPSCPGLIREQPSNLWLGSSRAGLKWSEITWEWGEHACSKSQLLGAEVELVHCMSVAGAPGGTCPSPGRALLPKSLINLDSASNWGQKARIPWCKVGFKARRHWLISCEGLQGVKVLYCNPRENIFGVEWPHFLPRDALLFLCYFESLQVQEQALMGLLRWCKNMNSEKQRTDAKSSGGGDQTFWLSPL